MTGKNHFLQPKKDAFLLNSRLELQWSFQDHTFYPIGGLFASVGQMENSHKSGFKDLFVKYVSLPEGLHSKNINGLKIKIPNPSLRRLISGGIAGAVSRTAVAPLETIRTHLMIGSSGNSTGEVFRNIINVDGWTGLFQGNFVNVIRVTPSKAVELFVYDTVNKKLSARPEIIPKLPISPSLIAGACAGVCSTLLTYPLELLKTRLTIQRGAYNGVVDAFVKILKEGGPKELYRGLTPSLIGVIPYAATNYYAYDTLRKAYRKTYKAEKIGNLETLLIGSGVVPYPAQLPFHLKWLVSTCKLVL